MAFYRDGKICPLVPEIIEKPQEAVEFWRGKYQGKLGKLVDELLSTSTREEGTSYKIFFLSAPDDSRTLKLKEPIINNLVSKSGAITAFTQNQRYVSEERLKTAKTTTELV